MAGNLLSVGVSMMLLFFLFALLVSALMEAVSSALKLRGQALMVALELLFDEARAETGSGGFGYMDRMRGRRALAAGTGDATSPQALFDAVFKGSLVGGLRPQTRPTYICPRHFAVAVLGALRDGRIDSAFESACRGIGKLPEGRLKQTLNNLAQDAEGDYERLKAGISGWFDEAMSRLSGEYKRFTQLFTFLIAMALAATLNVDAIRIGGRLLADPVLAKSIADYADARTKEQPAPQAGGSTGVDELKADLQSVGDARAALSSQFPFIGYPAGETGAFWKALFSTAFFGWLIMALSAIAGAPFWFDLLQRFVNLRGAGPKPDARTAGDGK